MTINPTVIEDSALYMGRTGLLMDFAYRLVCPKCRAAAIKQHPTTRKALVCAGCNHHFSSEDRAGVAWPYACDQCGILATLWAVDTLQLCAGCCAAWDAAGKPSLAGVARPSRIDESYVTIEELRIETQSQPSPWHEAGV